MGLSSCVTSWAGVRFDGRYCRSMNRKSLAWSSQLHAITNNTSPVDARPANSHVRPAVSSGPLKSREGRFPWSRKGSISVRGPEAEAAVCRYIQTTSDSRQFRRRMRLGSDSSKSRLGCYTNNLTGTNYRAGQPGQVGGLGCSMVWARTIRICLAISPSILPSPLAARPTTAARFFRPIIREPQSLIRASCPTLKLQRRRIWNASRLI